MKHYKSNKIKIFSRFIFLAFFFFLPFNIVQAEKSPLKIRVGIFQNRPIVFQDELGTPQGLYVDLLNEVAKQKNWRLEFVFDHWANSLERLKKNDINLMTSIAYTKERDSYMDFSHENILTMWGQVYVGKKSSIQNILDLEGLKVAILRDGINGINFQKLCKAFDIQCQFLVKDTYEDAVKLVEMGKADACVINNVHGYELEKKYEIRESPIMFNPFKLLFAVPEGKYGNILKTLDKQLKNWKQHDDSFYYQTLHHWYGGKISFKKVIPKWLIYSLILSIGIILLSLVWIKALQYQIKKRRKAEGALRASEERFRSVYHTAPLAFVVWDKNTRVTDWNKKAEEVFGWSKEEVVGYSFFDFIVPEKDRPHVEDVVDSLIKGELLSHSINDNLTKEGKIITCEWNNSLLHDDDGNIIGAISLGLDITDRKQAEEEKTKLQNKLQQSQKMEAIASLAGGIAHQFNNALSPVSVNLDMLEMDYPGDEKIANYTKQMKGSTLRMAELTSQLLAYARGGKYQAKTITINEFIDYTLPIIQPSINPDIRIEADLTTEMLNIEIDQTQMQMVLSAILINASEAMEGKGLIRISTKEEDIDEDFLKYHSNLKLSRYVRLTVEDNGKGMDKETRDRIFEPFFTTKFEGRGLGMASAYGIVKNHNGWISIYSEPGRGAVVRIYLPLIEARMEKPIKTTAEPIKGTGTILVIEDEQVVMDISRALLERLGYNVLAAMTGEEAVNIVKTFDGHIDLAILDLILPDMQGGAIYPLIMKVRPNLKVIACSGYSIDGSAQEILDSGAQAFIQKPFTVTTLSEKLKEVLDKK